MAVCVRCNRCHTMYVQGGKCPKCARRYDTEKRDKKKAAFYHSKAWKTVREDVIRYYASVDLWLLGLFGQLSPASRPIVHHIKEYEKYPELALDFNNLVVLGTTSHNHVHDFYDCGKYKEAVEIIERGKRLYEELKDGNYEASTEDFEPFR